jgi:Glycosyltransferase family 28 C-terminal domain
LPVSAKINKFPLRNPRVLVAPLDWGLGHATRCIPIIKELLIQRCNVIVACAGPQKVLLREEFPSLSFIELRGYEIKYDKNRALTILRLVSSIPKILIRIKQERAWLRHFVAREELDLVISDNRYGLTTPGIFCIFMTHQLLIKTAFGGWADRILQTLNYRTIQHFSRCWVPDITPIGLAGELSHPKRMPSISTRYIGWLSRFGAAVGTADLVGSAGGGLTGMDAGGVSGSSVAAHGDGRGGFLLALLSGPEPQRTLLEKDILRQAAELGKAPAGCRLVIVRGLPGGGKPVSGLSASGEPAASGLPAWISLHDHLPARALEPLIRDAGLILARPGYSTLMDLQRLGKRALLVPTPGQTEQEYLGPYLAQKGWASCVNQRDFSLAAAFEMLDAGGDGDLGAAAGIGAQEEVAGPGGQLAAEIKAVLAML